MESEQLQETNAQRPTDKPVKAIIGPQEYRLFGRKIIYADYTEEEMKLELK